MKLYIIRHGETEYNAKKLLSGRRDVDLSTNGVMQTQLLANRLSGLKFDRAISSDLSRAQKTLKQCMGERDFILTSLLQERDFGEFEGLPKQLLLDKMHQSESAIGKFRPKNGENFEDLENRFHDLWAKYLDGFTGTAILSGHGSINRSIIKCLAGLSYEEQRQISQDNTCVNVLNGEGLGSFEIEMLNCIAHL